MSDTYPKKKKSDSGETYPKKFRMSRNYSEINPACQKLQGKINFVLVKCRQKSTFREINRKKIHHFKNDKKKKSCSKTYPKKYRMLRNYSEKNPSFQKLQEKQLRVNACPKIKNADCRESIRKKLPEKY